MAMLRKFMNRTTDVKKATKASVPHEVEGIWGIKELCSGKAADLDIIAVHGLNGHRENTWTADSGILWLRDLLPAQLPSARILTYGYSSKTHSLDQLPLPKTIYGHGMDLLSAICLYREKTGTSHRPIIFIAHSLGGLVLKSALIHSNLATRVHNERYKALKLSTHGILFCGTPHQGGQGVTLAKLALTVLSVSMKTDTSLVKQLDPHFNGLHDQLEQFKSISSDFETLYFCETFPTPVPGCGSLLIVPPWSAAVPGTINSDTISLRKNHRTMVQFSSPYDNDFTIVATHISLMSNRADERIRSNWREWNGGTTIAAQNIACPSRTAPTVNLDALLTDPANFQVKFAVPYRRTISFVGRQDVFNELDSFFSKGHSAPAAVLYGIGGVGKTETVLQYIHEGDMRSNTVLWLNAASLSSIRDSFLRIAEQLVDHYVRLISTNEENLPYGKVAETLGLTGLLSDAGRLRQDLQDPDSVARAVLSWLEFNANERWLAVYDNYDDLEGFSITKFLPTQHRGRIIITSRRRDCARLGRGFAIDSLPVEDGFQLLLQVAQIYSEPSKEEVLAATQVVEKLAGLPLALDHAGGYIFTEMIQPSEYLTLLEKNTEKLLSRCLPLDGSDHGRDLVFSTLDTSFLAIHRLDPDAILLLTYCSFYGNFDIPLEVVHDMTATDVETHIAMLMSFSFLRRCSMDSIMIHPLVHAWARRRLSPEESKVRSKESLSTIVATTRSAEGARFMRSAERLDLERRLLVHIDIALSQVADIYNIELFIDQNTTLWMDCANFYLFHKRFMDAVNLHKQALESCNHQYGSDHLRTTRVKLGLSLSYCQENRNSEAAKLLEQCLLVFKEELGPNAFETSETLRGLADSYRRLGRLPQALEFITNAVVGYRQSLGDNHSQVYVALEVQALVQNALGMHEEALRVISEVITRSSEILGSNHPNILRNMLNKSVILMNMKKLDEARDIIEQVFISSEAKFGPLDSFTLTASHNLAFATYSLERYQEAEALCQVLIASYEKVFGKDKLSTLNSVELLGVVYHKQGRFELSKSCLQTALAGYQVLSHTAGNIPVYRTLVYLAQVCVSEDNVSEARRHYEKALDGYKEVLGIDHKTTLSTARDLLALCEAQEWTEDAAKIKQRFPGEAEAPCSSESFKSRGITSGGFVKLAANHCAVM